MRFGLVGRGCHNDTEVLVDICISGEELRLQFPFIAEVMDDEDVICFCTSDYCNFVNGGPSANILLLIILTLIHVYQIK